MGSLFYINVPTRTYEVSLRQKEKQIVVVQETDDIAKKNLPNNMASGLIGTARKRSSIRSAEIAAAVEGEISSGGTMLSEASTVIPSRIGSTVDVYEATAEGKKVNIVVSKDSMAIYTEEELKNTVEKLESSKDNKNDKKKGSDASNSSSIEQKFIESVISNTYLEKHLEDCLQKFTIYDATWSTSIDSNFSQISFTVSASRSEVIINSLMAVGIGSKYESTLSVCAAVVYCNPHQDELKKHEEDEKDEVGGDKEHPKKDTFASKFIASIKSRLTVAQVVQSVQNNAVITFDFIVMIIVAAIIAAVGLLENSSVNLVASMLISPLMGPIIACCFGAFIKDKKLIKTGIISELVGISMCFIVGFVFGVSVAWHPFPGPWAEIQQWPTPEMVSRSQPRGMWVGIFIAIPSGAGVALSILAGNAGSLVGVAISASLLPPAVNAGMEWGVSFVHALHSGERAFASCTFPDTDANSTNTRNEDDHLINHNSLYCPNNMAKEFAWMGICSFGLTVVNIILILLAGAAVLKIKEVAPHTTRKAMNRFWKEDLKAMRDYNRIHGTFNKQEIYNELNKMDNGSEVRDELKNDRVFAQVTQRNLFGTPVNILDTTQQDADQQSEKNRNDTEAGSGGGEGGSSGGGLFSAIGRLFGGRKPENEEETTTEDTEKSVDVKSKEADEVKVGSRNRPHLAKSTMLKPNPTKKTVAVKK